VRRLALLLVAVLALSACGGGSKSSGDAAQVTKIWQDFFSSKVDVSKKPAMIQNGAELKSAIDAIAQNPLAKNTSAKVSKVSIVRQLGSGGKQANVVYSIYLGNTAVLKNQRGYALQQNGHWVIGDGSLCGLLKLEGGKLPSICQKS